MNFSEEDVTVYDIPLTGEQLTSFPEPIVKSGKIITYSIPNDE